MTVIKHLSFIPAIVGIRPTNTSALKAPSDFLYAGVKPMVARSRRSDSDRPQH
jgi:hypothetical protein